MGDIQLHDPDSMRRALSRIAHEIVERSGSSEDLAFVGIRTRGWYLAKRLANRMTQIESWEVPCFSLDVSDFRDDRGHSERDQKKTVSAHDQQPFLHVDPLEGTFHLPDWLSNQWVQGKRVILVDDVLFTGRTVRAALDALSRYSRPAVIQLAVLIDRGHRELPIRPDYVGKNVPTAREERISVKMEEVDGEDSVWLHKSPVK